MKSILFIRHAKSSWDSPTLKDFDRPLNERGNKDAPMMAKRLLDKKINIDFFISSPAVRALTTATYFHQAYKAKKDHLITIPALFHASVDVFFDVIKQIDNKYDTVAIFSHNPGITAIVNSLGVARVDNMPTCSVFGVHAEINNWKQFDAGVKQFWLFDYPKLEQ
ncbi:histidine phosphatase family protein [soil metagenome]